MNQSGSNSTRFIIVTNQRIFLRDAKKISICFEVPHESGSLYHVLSHFIYNDLNMTRIESRPIPERSWEYRFFVDFEGNLADEAVKIRKLYEERLPRYQRIADHIIPVNGTPEDVMRAITEVMKSGES